MHTAGHSKPGRQAVVIIHGMGEQRPMDTVRNFVKTIWRGQDDNETPDDAGSNVWNKPDERTGSLALRRITTRKSQAGGAYTYRLLVCACEVLLLQSAQ